MKCQKYHCNTKDCQIIAWKKAKGNQAQVTHDFRAFEENGRAFANFGSQEHVSEGIMSERPGIVSPVPVTHLQQ